MQARRRRPKFSGGNKGYELRDYLEIGGVCVSPKASDFCVWCGPSNVPNVLVASPPWRAPPS